MTTSSPGAQRVTPSPTFQTTPEASEPPMWWSSAWERKTETGCPSAAQTLLKLTPAAITRTVTSNAPGSGTSISSIWKASIGSPKRSSRMTQAAMVAGSSPGSTSICAIWLTSTATRAPLIRESVLRRRMVPAPPARLSPPIVSAPPEVRRQERHRQREAAHAEDQEVGARVDRSDEPAEVLAEEARDERTDDEVGGEHA